MDHLLSLIPQPLRKYFNREVIMKAVFALLAISLFLGGCTYLNKKMGLEDDHELEEAFENKIKDELGLEIDLSPSSKED